MFRKIIWRIKEFIIDTVASYMVLGATCGLCGGWIKDEIVPDYWRWSICKECMDEQEDPTKLRESILSANKRLMK